MNRGYEVQPEISRKVGQFTEKDGEIILRALQKFGESIPWKETLQSLWNYIKRSFGFVDE